DFAVTTIDRDAGHGKFDAVAGGETAGIAFAAWVAERMNLPMQYVRKKPKGVGRSKLNFVKAIREAGGLCEHCFVIFFYDIYPEGKKILADLGVTLHALTT